jgi:ubiquinone/menaquinone biosynthesis C-methylase UbiE
MAVKLDGIVPWGRSFDEYVRMFALSQADLGRTILDCAAGPASFTAEMHRRGGCAVAADPVYAYSAEDIRRRVEGVRKTMMEQVRQDPGQFVWHYIKSPEDLEETRMGAIGRFLADYSEDADRERYLARSLPDLNFAGKSFDLALCSHFLFLYSEDLDTAFHLAAVRELLRVAGEVRIFPVTDMSGRPSSHLEAVRREFPSECVRVEYEFLRGANEMLVVSGLNCALKESESQMGRARPLPPRPPGEDKG